RRRGAAARPRLWAGRGAPGPRRHTTCRPGSNGRSLMVVSIAGHGAARARRALERCVARGGVAVFPADTLYGLACDPSSAAAIDRIGALKAREQAKSSAVMFFAPLAMRELVSSVGPRTREALAALLPGPVTLVVNNPDH